MKKTDGENTKTDEKATERSFILETDPLKYFHS